MIGIVILILYFIFFFESIVYVVFIIVFDKKFGIVVLLYVVIFKVISCKVVLIINLVFRFFIIKFVKVVVKSGVYGLICIEIWFKIFKIVNVYKFKIIFNDKCMCFFFFYKMNVLLNII